MTDRQTAIEAAINHIAVVKARSCDSEFYMNHVTTLNTLVHAQMQLGDLCLAKVTCDTLTATVDCVERCFMEARSACDRIEKDMLGRMRPVVAVRNARVRASKARRMEASTRAVLEEELMELNGRRMETGLPPVSTSSKGAAMLAGDTPTKEG